MRDIASNPSAAALADMIDEAIQEMIYDDKGTAKALLRQVAAVLRGEAE